MFDEVKIVFGMDLDGSSWSCKTSVNEYVCGPLGLLKYIETRVGRTAKEVNEAVRIAAYQKKISAAVNANPKLACARSFAADAWSTAKQMLEWRDQVKEFKRDLNFPKGVSRRLDDIVAIEAAGGDLPEGVVDRVIALLNTDRHIAREINIVGRHQDLPQLWCDLIEANFDCTSLWRPERPLPGIEIVRAHDEVALAREFARWIAADVASNSDVALIVEGDSTLLDNELKAMGMPAIGNANSSALRSSLQILPAEVAAIWNGRDIGTPATAEEIEAALNRADSELEGRVARDELSKIARKHVGLMRSLTAGIGSMRRAQLLRMVESVIGSGCARPGAWNETGCPKVFKSPGAMFTLSDGDESHPRSKYTLWWDFTGRPPAARMRLTEAERNALGARGIEHDEEAARNRELSAWRLPLENTTRKLVLFAPYVKEGASAALHPLYEYLAKELGKDDEGEDRIKSMTRDAVGLIGEDGVWHLADRTVDTLEKRESSRRKFEDAADLPRVDHVPETVSQSQMERMISCPFAWYHEYYLGLKPGEAARDESVELRTGSHAHKVVEKLVERGVRDVNGVNGEFDSVFEEFLPKYLGELLEPESLMQRNAYHELLQDSVVNIFRKIEDEGLEIVGCEVEKVKEGFEGSKLHGYIDMLLKDRDGNDVVFDFKWSHGRKRYEDSIKEGKSIQFAVYHHLLGGNAKCYYYLFPLKLFIEDTQDNAQVFKNVRDSYAMRLDEVKNGVVKKAIVVGLDSTTVEEKAKRAAEIAAAGLKIDLPARCRFCGLNELCGKERKCKEDWK